MTEALTLFDQLRMQQSQSTEATAATLEETILPVDEPTELNSGMPAEARRTLVNLLRHGVILASQKAKLFETLCRYQTAIRHHLADVYLKLILDEKAGVAFVAGIDEESEDISDAISLITRRTLSLYDTLLLLVLRKHYQEREATGELRIVLDVERIESHLTPFLPLTNSMKSDRKKLLAAIQKMIEKRILNTVIGTDDRFEITPVIRYVVNADFLDNLLMEYQRLAKESAGSQLDTNDSANHPNLVFSTNSLKE